MNKQERQRKVEELASRIFERRVASGHQVSYIAEQLRSEAMAAADAFYPAEDAREELPPPSVPIKK